MIEYMVATEKEINQLERKNELMKARKKEIDDRILLDQMNNMEDKKDDELDNNDSNQYAFTCTIQKRNLSNVDALDNEQLESLKKLRSIGLFLRSMDQEEANAKSTDFNENDLKHLDKMNEMKKKKLGKTAVNIMLSNANIK